MGGEQSRLIKEGNPPEHLCAAVLPATFRAKVGEVRQCSCDKYYALTSNHDWALSDEHGCTFYRLVKVSGAWWDRRAMHYRGEIRCDVEERTTTEDGEELDK